MKNLCKIVSIVLCVAMVMAMFVFSTSALEQTTKVTSLAVGDTIIFTYTNGTTEVAMGTYDNSGKIRSSVSTSEAVKFTVEAGSTDGSFSFKDPDGKYLAWSSSLGGGNKLYNSTTKDAASSWTVTFDASGKATIKNGSDSTRMLQYNAGSPRFACYTSSQQKPILYKITTVESTDVVDVDGAHIRLSVHSLELKEQLHIRHFVHVTDTSVEISASTRWGLQYWTPEDYAALTLVDGQPAFDAEPTQEYDFIETATPNGDDDKYYATTGGIVAADINDVQYIRAYIVIGTTTYYTPVQAYSVSTYLSAVEESPSYGVNSDLYKTVEALIAYGEAAAKLFG